MVAYERWSQPEVRLYLEIETHRPEPRSHPASGISNLQPNLTLLSLALLLWTYKKLRTIQCNILIMALRSIFD